MEINNRDLKFLIESKRPKTLLISVVAVIMLIYILYFWKILNYEKLYAVVHFENNAYSLKTLIEDEKVNNFLKSSIIIGNKKKEFKLIKIKKFDVIEEHNKLYKEIYISVDLSEEIINSNLPVEIISIQPKTTFIKKIIERWFL